MMKLSNKFVNKRELYILVIYFFVASVILINFNQSFVFEKMYGGFNFGEMIFIMFNDSYTGYYTFIFMLSFIMLILVPKESNIVLKITRYENRKQYYLKRHNFIVWQVLKYFIVICACCFLIGIINFNFSLNMSTSLKKYAEVNFGGVFQTDNLWVELLKTLILQMMVFYFFVSIHLLLNNFRLSQALIFTIYAFIHFNMAGIALGYFGESLKVFSVFTIGGSIYNFNQSFLGKFAILFCIDALLAIISFVMFLKIDISLPKGSKQYQNE